MSEDRRYELRVTFKRNPPSAPDATDTEVLARTLRIIAGSLEHHQELSNTTMGELFDYEHQYGYWNLRPVLERDSDVE